MVYFPAIILTNGYFGAQTMKLLIRPPQFIRIFYPASVWRMSKDEPTIYLTFDDGPIPNITSWVLDILKEYRVKATFFCVGENIQKHPALFKRIKEEGHRVGNHTYHHLKGWKTSHHEYVSNVQECQHLTQTELFRPPYGRITKKQYNLLRKTHKIVFWDVLSHDYNPSIPPERCLKHSLNYTRNGSIIVFHDSIKAEKNLNYVLPLYIQHFLALNYRFEVL